MSHFRFGGSDRRGYGDDFRDRRWFGGGDRFDGPRERFGGSGRRDQMRRRSRSEKNPRVKSEGRDRRDKYPRGEDRGQGVKRKAEDNTSSSNPKKLKPGNNWHGEDRHALMHALTMESKPENLENEWLFVVRPVGRRRIVVAANNVTQSYNNVHAPDMKFETCLPSGNVTKDPMFKQQDLTILDTIYSPEQKKFFIVDMVHWRHYPYYETEAEFRFFCLEDKWLQLEKPGEIWKLNDHPLQLLHKYPCSSENIEEALKDFTEKVDDILFIKKNSMYKPSESPDCLKLRLDKLSSVLGIAVPEGVDFIPTSSKPKDELKKEHNKEVKDEKSTSEKKDEDIGSEKAEDKQSHDSNEAADPEVEDDEGKKEMEEDEAEHQDDDNSMDQADV